MPDNELMPDSKEFRPYPNEHAARIKDPDLFKTGDDNWGSKDIAPGIRIILGILESSGKWETQAYRFKSNKFTVAEAKKWLKDHDIKYISFEPATGENKFDEMSDIERRTVVVPDAEMRIEDGEKRKLIGYAAKFGKQTDLGFFKEKIQAGAFDEVLKSSDTRALKNHDPNLLLGRESSGTLRLKSNSVGLQFEIDVPDTTAGRDTVEEIRRGDLNGCSFAFIVAEDEWKHSDGEPSERTILRIGKLYDVGPVTYPAYEDTSVTVRALEMAKETPKPPAPEEKKVEYITEAEQRELDRRYRTAKRIIARNKKANA